MKNVTDIYELSPIQQGMLYDSLAANAPGLYLIQLSYTIRWRVRQDAFVEAWNRVVARHPVLRTSFQWDGLEKPLQLVSGEVELPFNYEDLRELPPEGQTDRLQAIITRNQEQGFRFDTAPLMALHLLQLEEDRYQLIWAFHHILLEGWSASVVLQEVYACYNSLITGEPIQLDPPKPYREYIAWLHSQDMQAAKQFWTRQLRGFQTPTPLGIGAGDAGDSGPVTAYDGTQVIVPGELSDALRGFCKQNNLTLNTLMQGAWALLLSAYSGERDVTFGVIVSGRSIGLQNVEQMVGLFINILPARIGLERTDRVVQWLKQIQSNQVAARKYEFCPLVDVKACSDVPAGVPLFESILIFENWHGDVSMESADMPMRVEKVTGYQGGPGYPLALIVDPAPEIALSLSYDTDRFDRSEIHRMLTHLQFLLSNMIREPAARLENATLSPPDRVQRFYCEWNAASARPDKAPLVHEAIQAIADSTPDAIAVEHVGSSLTYGALVRRARNIASFLQSQQLQQEQLVGLCMERTPDTIATLLGILTAGAAYVPIDPELPENRIRTIVDEANIKLAICSEGKADLFPSSVSTHTPRSIENALNGRSTGVDRVRATDDSLAYVIFTSGSTGKPKGVMVQHGSLANYVQHAQRSFDVTNHDRVLQFASLSFDTAAEEIFPTLASGGTLVLRTDVMLSTTSVFLAQCARYQLTVLDLPTAFWHTLAQSLEAESMLVARSLRLVIIGGEAAESRCLRQWHAGTGDDVRLMNTYGPTEATIVATECELVPARERFDAPIGKPVSNLQAFVQDNWGRLTEPGFTGELMLGGAGLARGYLHRPALTAERFVPDGSSGLDGRRLYRSGDLARVLPDGTLFFNGRADSQIKVRGYRIEPGEINAVLTAHPEIADAATVLQAKDATSSDLVAYFVPANGGPAPSTGSLREFCLDRLPPYMVPQAWIELDKIPRTVSGKLDRRALPVFEPGPGDNASGKTEPSTPDEMKIAALWEETLGVEKPGVQDSFLEFGGHSLKAMQLLAKISEAFHVDISVRAFFDEPTIAGLSAAITRATAQELDDSEMAEMLKDLDALSDDEAREALQS